MSSPLELLRSKLVQFFSSMYVSAKKGELHYYLFAVILLLTFLFYDNTGYELYLIGSIIVLGASYYLSRKGGVKLLAGNIIFILIWIFDLFSSVGSLILGIDVITSLVLVLDVSVGLSLLIFFWHSKSQIKEEK